MVRPYFLSRFAVMLSGLLLASLVWLGAAYAAPDKNEHDTPMSFQIVRWDETCFTACVEWIAAQGEITSATPAAFRRILKTLGKRRLPIIISSPGGDVNAAFEMGRLIRSKKLDVAVGRTRFTGCAPADKTCKLSPERKGVYSGMTGWGGGYCASACPLVLAGGVRRLAGPSDLVGIHQIQTTFVKQKVEYRITYRMVNGKKREVSRKIIKRKNVGSYTSTKPQKAVRKKMLAYLKEMNVSKDYYERSQAVPHDSIRWLTTTETSVLNLTTHLDGAEWFVEPQRCEAQPLPYNCVPVADANG